MSEKKDYKSKVHCRTCKNKTNHSILAKHGISEEVCESGFFFEWTEDYMIIQCKGCDTISFLHEYDDPNMHYTVYSEDGEAIEVDHEDITIYPSIPLNQTNGDNHYTLIEFQYVPGLLETLYKQVVASYELEHYLLAAAGLRMIIEGICNHLSIIDGYIIDDSTGKIRLDKQSKQIRSKNLTGRINGLVEMHILTESQTSILHSIRKLGNQTVHGLDIPKSKIILAGLEIIEHTFKNIFELKKFKSLESQLNN